MSGFFFKSKYPMPMQHTVSVSKLFIRSHIFYVFNLLTALIMNFPLILILPSF